MPGFVAVVLLLFAQGVEEQYRSGLLLLKEGRVDEAVRRLDAAAQQFPQFPLVWLALGEARLRQDNPDAALDAARRARPSADRDPDVRGALVLLYYRIGTAYVRKPDPAAAAQWQEAIRLDPARPAFYLDLARLFLDHRTLEPAQLVLDHALGRFPRHAELRRLLGLARYAQGRNREALDAFLASSSPPSSTTPTPTRATPAARGAPSASASKPPTRCASRWSGISPTETLGPPGPPRGTGQAVVR